MEPQQIIQVNETGSHALGEFDLKPYDILSLIFVTFLLFGFGLTLSFEKFGEKVKHDLSPLLFGLHVQYLVFPAAAYGLGAALDLPNHFRAALIILGTMPGGAMSNFLALLFQSDFHLSLVMTTVSTLAALLMIPFNMWLYFVVIGSNSNFQLSWTGILISTFCVIFGVSMGMAIGPRLSEQGRIRGEIFGQLSGLGILVAGSWRNSESNAPLWNLPPLVYVSIVLFIVTGLIYSLLLSILLRYKKPIRLTVIFECVVQNASLGIGILTASVRDEELRSQAFAIPILQIFASFIVCFPFGMLAWKLGWSNVPPEENVL